jgi:hypothetical protein
MYIHHSFCILILCSLLLIRPLVHVSVRSVIETEFPEKNGNFKIPRRFFLVVNVVSEDEESERSLEELMKSDRFVSCSGFVQT